MTAEPAIAFLAEVFGLTAFERDVLLLCAGVEMDSQLAAQCGTLKGRTQPGCATFDLALAALPDPHWSALTPSRPLRHYRLLEVGAGHGLTSAPLRIDERILHFLAGINLLEPRLRPFAHINPYPDWIADSHTTIAVRAQGILENHGNDCPILHLCGDDAQGQEDVAGLASRNAGRHLLVLPVENLQAAADFAELAILWEREMLLLPATLLIQCGAEGLVGPARRLAEMLPAPLIVASRDPIRLNRPLLRLDVDKPRPAELRGLWERALGPAALHCNGTLAHLAEQFRLSARTVFSTGAVAAPGTESAGPDELWNACRSLARPRLDDLAERIVPAAQWDDLILPELQKMTLRQLSAQARHRMQVHETWGFSARGRRGLGLSVLFAGDSGTGKTLAAEVLACDLRLDLYRIDLSAVVSKYIGETEKNLKRVFDAAEEGGAVLLFDEADALFGKRSEVKDSHDRYANIEVSYLLQRMEAYQGLAILTTNMKVVAGPRLPASPSLHRQLSVPGRGPAPGHLEPRVPGRDAHAGLGAGKAVATQRGRRQHSQHRPERRVLRRTSGQPRRHGSPSAGGAGWRPRKSKGRSPRRRFGGGYEQHSRDHRPSRAARH